MSTPATGSTVVPAQAADMHKNSRCIPHLLDDTKGSFLLWLDEIELWESCTDLPKEKRAPMVIVCALKKAPIAHKVAIAGWRTYKADWARDTGLKDFLDFMKGELKVSDFMEKNSRLIVFLRLTRANQETHKDFIKRFKDTVSDLQRDACALMSQDYLLNVVLFAGLRLSRQETQILRASADMEKDSWAAYVSKVEDLILETKLSGLAVESAHMATDETDDQCEFPEDEYADHSHDDDYEHGFLGEMEEFMAYFGSGGDWGDENWTETGGGEDNETEGEKEVDENSFSAYFRDFQRYKKFSNWCQGRNFTRKGGENGTGKGGKKGKGGPKGGSKGKGKKGKGKN